VAALVPLALMLGVLLPGWIAPEETYVTDVSAQVGSPLLLMGVGLALAMRAGVIDLSVWMLAVAGGLIGAVPIAVGAPFVVGLVAAVAFGAAVGVVSGWLVRRTGLASIWVTGGVGAVLFAVLAFVPAGGVEVPDDSFRALLVPAIGGVSPLDGMAERAVLPLVAGRTILIVGIYAAVMAMVLIGRNISIGVVSRRRLALVVSGALAALAGACGLIDHGRTASAVLPVGDVRPLAAALLAGAPVLAGKGRALLVGLVVPLGLLGATVWGQRVWMLPAHGIEWHAIGLVCLATATAVSVRFLRDRRGPWAWAGYGLSLAAVAILVVEGAWGGATFTTALRVVGVILAVGAALSVGRCSALVRAGQAGH